MNNLAFPKPVKEPKRVKPQKFSSKVAKEIKERDGCCIICRSESQLTAHHVFFHTFERIRDGKQNNIDKGVTLCVDCHTGFKGVHNGNELIDEACHLYLSELYK